MAKCVECGVRLVGIGEGAICVKCAQKHKKEKRK